MKKHTDRSDTHTFIHTTIYTPLQVGTRSRGYPPLHHTLINSPFGTPSPGSIWDALVGRARGTPSWDALTGHKTTHTNKNKNKNDTDHRYIHHTSSHDITSHTNTPKTVHTPHRYTHTHTKKNFFLHARPKKIKKNKKK